MPNFDSSSSAARQALLDTINEREKELGKIRDAAEKIIEEEQRTSEKQMQNLQSHVIEQQNLLTEKEDCIQKLCCQINVLERDYQEQERRIVERSKEEVERQVEKIQSKLEKEYSIANKDQESRERKRLQREFEEKLASCEKKFESDYQASMLVELKRQEESLWLNMERITTEKQSRFERVEAELGEIIRQKDKDILDITRQYESQYENSQTKFICELQNQKDHYEKMHHELKQKNDHLKRELEKENEQHKFTKDQLSQEKKEADYAKNQVEQLLDVLHNAEMTYVQKVQQFQFTESTKDNEISTLLDQMDKISRLLKETKENQKLELKRIRKFFVGEKKSLQGKISRLRNELDTVNDYKTKEVESTKTMSDQKESKILNLKKELGSLQQKCIDGEEKAIRMEKQSYQLQKELELKCEEIISSKIKIQELQASLKLEKKGYEDRLQNVVKERDDSNHTMQKEIIDLKIQNHASRTSAEIESSTIRDLREENKRLHSTLEGVNAEKSSLKETVKEMRIELEKVIASTPNPEPQLNREDLIGSLNIIHDELKTAVPKYDDSTLEKTREIFQRIWKIIDVEQKTCHNPKSQDDVQKLKRSCSELSSELKIVTKERNHLINLSNKLKCDISRLSKRDETGCGALEINEATDSLREDSFNVDDLARTLWSNALQESTKERSKIPFRASDRTTTSQRDSLRNMRREKEKKSENIKSIKTKIKARNWNNKGDTT